MNCEFGCEGLDTDSHRDFCYRWIRCAGCNAARMRDFCDIWNRFVLFCGNCHHKRFCPPEVLCITDDLAPVLWMREQLRRAGDDWLLNEAVRSILPFPVWEEMDPHLISGKPPNE